MQCAMPQVCVMDICGDAPQNTRLVFRVSFFSKSHLHIPDTINFIITYAEEQSHWKCAQSARVGYCSTAVDWGSFCRDLCVEYYVREIRDVKLWTFGLVERNTNRLKLFPVDRRDADTLMSLTEHNVETGSTVTRDS